MAAYAALTSLHHTTHDLHRHPISLNKKLLQSLNPNATFFLEFLQLYNSPFANTQQPDPFEMSIADAAQDVIESYVVDRILANSASDGNKKISFPNWFRGLNLKKPQKSPRKVIHDMDMMKKQVEKTMTEKPLLQQNVSTSLDSLRYSPREHSSIMVGFNDLLLEIMDKLTGGRSDRQLIPIVGMAGIGKTTLAMNVYAKPLVKARFDICAWTTISQKYDTKEILCEVLSQANGESKEQLRVMSDNEIGLAVHQYLSHRRYLILMDDMWSIEAWEKIQHFFPDNGNSSRIVVTTRLSCLGSQLDKSYGIRMKFLDEVSSWNLFCRIVFREQSVPPELEEIGRKIVRDCRGLPLSIVVMGGLLQKLEHTPKCWKSIGDNLNAILNSENDEYCLKILRMSYNHLPAYLKPCFLYTGVFEEDCRIRVSTLVKLWVSEGFLKPISGKNLETVAKEYLKDLVDRNLVLVHELGSLGSIKYCKIHDLLRDLCWREAEREGFYNVIGQHKSEGLNRQRCVVIPRSTSNREVLESLQSMEVGHSFICHNEEVQLFPKSKLLRIFKAYDRDRLGNHSDYSFDDLFRFINSRYLSVGVRWDSEFPSSVNLLWNLQTLIICHSGFVIVPRDIWKMTQLRHIEFYKGEMILPYHLSEIMTMENLQTLKGVCSFRYGVEASKIIPNIKKLGVTDGIIPNLECLSKLECFCCWSIYPKYDDMNVRSFPQSLKKLSLASYTFHMEVEKKMLLKIGALPLLQKLKLERVNFQGCKWKTIEGQFPSLKFLQLKWCRLESWTTESSHFPCLEQLHLYGLRELEEIPWEIGEISTLHSIVLEYCSESVVESAKKIAEEQDELQVRVAVFNNTKNQSLRRLVVYCFGFVRVLSDYKAESIKGKMEESF